MATIEGRKGKGGKINCYRITVAQGRDSTGRQIRRRTTWTPPRPNMTPRQIEKALAAAVFEFEQSVKEGFLLDQRQTFAAYADYVISLKARTGVRPRTVDRYRELLPRINAAIGHMKLSDIRPQHLNAFYKNLGEEGIREDGERATAKIDLVAWMKNARTTRAKIALDAGVSPGTVTVAFRGQPIRRSTAEAIAAAMGERLQDVFTLKRDIRPLSDKTILEHHRLISTVLAQAEKEMLVKFNPAAKATPPKVQHKEPDYYQPEEVDAILDALETAPLKWKVITYLLIDTGCRRGEIMGLKWDSVDLATGILTIERALLYSQTRGVYEGPPKSGKSRTVRVAKETLALLKHHRVAQMELQLTNGDRWVNSGYVFTQDNGERMNPDSVTDWPGKFSAARSLPHIHPHAFRHTAASTMIASGVDLVTTANELGHANATITATIYAHQIAHAKAKAEEARSSVFSRLKRA